MTREELVSIATSLGDLRSVSRFKSCLHGFKDVSSFLDATKGDLMKAYAVARPESAKGLGRKFWQLMNKVSSAVKERALQDKKALAEKQRIEDEKNRLMEEERKAHEAECFTYKQLRAITAFMELGGIDKIDLRKFRAFCDSVHVSTDLTSPTEKSGTVMPQAPQTADQRGAA